MATPISSEWRDAPQVRSFWSSRPIIIDGKEHYISVTASSQKKLQDLKAKVDRLSEAITMNPKDTIVRLRRDVILKDLKGSVELTSGKPKELLEQATSRFATSSEPGPARSEPLVQPGPPKASSAKIPQKLTDQQRVILSERDKIREASKTLKEKVQKLAGAKQSLQELQDKAENNILLNGILRDKDSWQGDPDVLKDRINRLPKDDLAILHKLEEQKKTIKSLTLEINGTTRELEMQIAMLNRKLAREGNTEFAEQIRNSLKE